jgi:hypothetical protein
LSVADATGADERLLARGALSVLAVLALPAAATAAVVGGLPAAASALIGLGFVLVLFGASALLLSWVAGRRPSTALAVLVGGVAGRLVLYAATLSALTQVAWIHRPSLALATGAAVAVTLAYELRVLSRTPRLFWVDAGAPRPSALTNATRSRSL